MDYDDISSVVGLHDNWKRLLKRAQLLTVSEVLLETPESLCTLLKIERKQASALIFDLSLAQERRNEDTRLSLTPTPALTLAILGLDSVLDPGISVNSITELCGAAGTGKSHLCLELALSASLPYELGGVEGGTIFISSEGNLPANRMFDLASSVVARAKTHGVDLTERALLDAIHIEKAPDADTLYSLVKYFIPAYIGKLQSNMAIKLVIIDSLTSIFRVPAASYFSRTKELSDIADALKVLANVFHCAVVVVNQVSAAPALPTLYPSPPEKTVLNKSRNEKLSDGTETTSLQTPLETQTGAGSQGSSSQEEARADVADSEASDEFDTEHNFVQKPVSTQRAHAVTEKLSSPEKLPLSSITMSAPSPYAAPHIRHNLPELLYAQYQNQHFNGQLAFSDRGQAAALGHSWTNLINTRIALSFKSAYHTSHDAKRAKIDPSQKKRTLSVVFSPLIARASVDFIITQTGLDTVSY